VRSASRHQQIAGIDLLVTVELRLSNVAGRQFDSEDSASTPPTSSTCPDTTAGNCCALFCAPLRRISPGIHGSDPTACPSFPVSKACCFPQPVVLHLTSTQSPMSHCSADISLRHEVLQQCCDSAATVLRQQRPASAPRSSLRTTRQLSSHSGARKQLVAVHPPAADAPGSVRRTIGSGDAAWRRLSPLPGSASLRRAHRRSMRPPPDRAFAALT